MIDRPLRMTDIMTRKTASYTDLHEYMHFNFAPHTILAINHLLKQMVDYSFHFVLSSWETLSELRIDQRSLNAIIYQDILLAMACYLRARGQHMGLHDPYASLVDTFS